MVGAGDCGWGHGHHWDRMDAEGDLRPQAPHPHPHRLQRLPQRRLLYIAPFPQFAFPRLWLCVNPFSSPGSQRQH